MASRIFIRSLPPNFSDSELRSHFSTPSKAAGTKFSAAVTDAKFFPRKRIGYVGYKTVEDAERAVAYFNRSFIRLSRISVEIAKQSTDQQLVYEKSKRQAKRELARDGDDHDEKRRRTDGVVQSEPVDEKAEREKQKLDEYLSLMGSTKTKAWANGQDLDAHQVDPAAMVEEEDEGDYQDLPAKSSPAGLEEENGLVESEQDGQPASGENVALKPISDADWLSSLSKNSKLDDESWEGFPDETEEIVETGEQDAEMEDSVPTKPVKVETESEPARDSKVEKIQNTCRLFLRNLAFTTTEDELKEAFDKFENLESAHICLDKNTGAPKGIAFVQFSKPDSAVAAYTCLDGQFFQGRILHILPADRPLVETVDFDMSKLSYKKQQELKLKAESAKRKFNWNALYMNPDAVISSTAKRFAVSKSAILDPTSSDSAVKQALAETHIIQETKTYFTKHGVDLDAFKHKTRGDRAILIKNFEFGTTPEALRDLFGQHGTITRLLFPPAGTCAIVELERADQAKTAFGKLKYSRIGNSLLFLEMAPADLFVVDSAARIETTEQSTGSEKTGKEVVAASDLLETVEEGPVETTSVFVKNLNFTTTSDGLVSVFGPIAGFVSGRVKTKANLKDPSQRLSMGFGFVEFRTKEAAEVAVKTMDGFVLDGHKLQLKASNRGVDAAEQRRKEDNARKRMAEQTKLVVKNLPFQATKSDIRMLFAAHGQLRSVRVPKKMDNTSRGFAFAEFTTPLEARAAMNALGNTHLLGRKLVIQYAEAETVDPEQEIAKMQKKVGSQLNKVAVNSLVGTGKRQRFVADGKDDEDE